METEEQRQVRREQLCINLERQSTERREDSMPGKPECLREVSKGRLGWSKPGCMTGRPGRLRVVSKEKLKLTVPLHNVM